MNTCMIYTAVGGPEEARKLAKMLVSEQLVACVNIVDGATSVYRWEGKVQSSEESLLIAKTTNAQRDTAIERLNDLHSYDTPCIVAYDMSAGVPEYLNWLASETGSS
ncbi:MAG: divalent cation tolerance protein CutA [Alphaproteobacteria bacterium]|nr:divalent cation tolerance protein CutA [Alphaproteobacteria bacterium]